MRSGVRHVLSAIVLASVAVAATGCNHDTLGGGSQELNVTYTTIPGAGRYELASFDIKRILVVPTDPTAAALFDTERLQLSFLPFTASLTATQDVPFAHLALSPGTYRVALMDFTPPALVDEQGVDATRMTTCVDYTKTVRRLTGSSPLPQGVVPALFTLNDPPGISFTVRQGQTNLVLTVDVAGLIEGYEAAFAIGGCELVPCLDTSCRVNPLAKLNTFDSETFKTALLKNVTFE